MRLVGMALLAAWLVAWAAAPKGEPRRQTSVVGAVAVAGGDDAALAWLEIAHGTDGTLHVVTVDGEDRVRTRLRLPAPVNATSFRLADAGNGVFVLAVEQRRGPDEGAASDLQLRRIGPGLDEQLPSVPLTPGAAWDVAAAGREIVVVQSTADVYHCSFFDTAEPRWWADHSFGGPHRTLIGAGGGHVIGYDVDDGYLVVGGGTASVWTAQVGRPACFGDGGGRATVTSVVGLRGGYARLSRRGASGCVDGIRDGKPFAFRDVPLDGIQAARLEVDGDGRLAVHEEQDAQVTRRRVVLPSEPGGRYRVDERTVAAALDAPEVRYRLFGGEGRLGVTSLATRATTDETQVVLERNGAGTARVLAPARHFHPDHRPMLRRLAALPLVLLALGAWGVARLRRRLAKLAPLPREVPLRAGQAVVDGELAADADAPAGGLRVRRARERLTIFVEGATVLRASDVRPRTQPRGDAVDVASGSTVVASGAVEPGTLYRAEPTLRARRGDLVLVGCTLAEARCYLARRFAGSLALLVLASTVVLSLALSR